MLASQFCDKRIFVKKGLKQGLHPGVTITVGMYTDRLLLVKSLISFFYIHEFLIPYRERAILLWRYRCAHANGITRVHSP